MTARLLQQLVYDAPVAAVRDMLLDPAFRDQVLADQHVLRGSARVDGSVVTVDRVMASNGLPSFATKIVGHEIEIVQVETWTSDDHADVEITIPGKPGEIHGTIDLHERDGRTVERVDLTVHVRIPLVGSKVEALVENMLEKALDREEETGTRWLAQG